MHDGIISEQVSFDFSGKVVIITGAARGIGRAMVKAFVDSGARVLVADRDAEGLSETCALFGEEVAAVVGDISTVEGAKAIVDEAVNRFGGVDVCVNNAAVAPHTALLEERAEVWDRVYAVNCRGTFLMTQTAARAMIGGGKGGGSSTSHQPQPRGVHREARPTHPAGPPLRPSPGWRPSSWRPTAYWSTL